MRPLLSWSAVSLERALAYAAPSALALQYCQPVGAPDSDEANSTSRGSAQPYTLLRPFYLGSTDATAGRAAGPPLPPPGSPLRDYLAPDANWDTFQLDVASGETVVEVSGCRGGLLEALVLRTSARRQWSGEAGPGFVCSAPFRAVAPPGGYLLAMQVSSRDREGRFRAGQPGAVACAVCAQRALAHLVWTGQTAFVPVRGPFQHAEQVPGFLHVP
jgi:hypothetical protein